MLRTVPTLRVVADDPTAPPLSAQLAAAFAEVAEVAREGLELPRSRGHLILGETSEEGGPGGSSSEVPARVPS